MKHKIDPRQLALDCDVEHFDGSPPIKLPPMSDERMEHLKLEALVPVKGFMRDKVNNLKDQCTYRTAWPIEVYTEKLRELLREWHVID